MNSRRNYLWDNMKALLIFLVVLGHFLEKFPMDFKTGKLLDEFIYMFHMPAFIFVSGFWAKGYCKNGKPRPEKIAYFVSYYVIFQLIFTFIIQIFTPTKAISLLEPAIGLWYLLAMIIYYLIIPVIENLPAPLIIGAFMVVGLFIGYEKEAGSFAGVSRTLVFSPFFFAGYYTPVTLIDKMRSIKNRILIGVLTFFAALTIWTVSNDEYGMTLFFGKANFKALKFDFMEGITLRYLSWILGALMIISLILLLPSKKTIFSFVGERSIQAYLFHFPLIIVFTKVDLSYLFIIDTTWEFILTIIAAVAFTLLLSIKPLSYPFKWIQMLTDKIIKTHN